MPYIPDTGHSMLYTQRCKAPYSFPRGILGFTISFASIHNLGVQAIGILNPILQCNFQALR